MTTISPLKTTLARIPHKCNYCQEPIVKDTHYLKGVFKIDDVYTWKSHTYCQQLASKLDMFDSDYGCTSDSFQEYVINEYGNINKTAKEDVEWLDMLQTVLEHHNLIPKSMK